MPIFVCRCSLRSILLLILELTFAFSLNSLQAVAQNPPGIQMFSTNEYGVDLATGNVNISIPLRSKTGKVPFWSKIVGTSGMGLGDYLGGTNNQFQPMLAATLVYQDPSIASLSFNVAPPGEAVCFQDSLVKYYTENINEVQITDSTGNSHPFPEARWQITDAPSDEDGQCPHTVGTIGPFTTTDGSGYTMTVTDGNPTVYDSAGNYLVGTCTIAGGCQLAPAFFDPDGASISHGTTSSGGASVIDSLNTTVLTGATIWNILTPTLSYLDVNGNPQNFTSAVALESVATNFQCGDPVDRPPSAVNLLTSLTLPDGGQYMFSYEKAQNVTPLSYTGRLQTISFPSGGSISYGYSEGNSGILCGPQTVPKLTVTVDDNNGNNGSYIYLSSLGTTGSTWDNFTVTKTDPANNQTVYTFSGEFQTQAVTYQGGCPTGTVGCNGGGTLLRTVTTCYNQNYVTQSACVTPSSAPILPVTQTDVYTSLNSGGYSLTETVYDTYGNVTHVKNYDYGATFPPSGTPLSEVQTVYNMGNTCGTLSSYIYDLPCTITTFRSGSTASQVSYTYSATGHPTQTTTSVGGSATPLTSTASYNLNGTVATIFDVNTNTQSTYGYNETGNCVSPVLPMFPTSVTITGTGLPSGGLITSSQWDCNGGVFTSSTDMSGATTTYGYVSQGQSGTADPLWRLRSSTDARLYTTWTTYSPGKTLPVTVESALAISSGSAADSLTTYDGLGRPYVTQKRTAPGSSSFDNTVVTTYDPSGRAVSVSMPCVSTASIPCSSPVLTTTTYDGLNRPLTVTDGGGGIASYTYNANDTLQAVSPAPSGENSKARQMQVDGLGRLTSVCEVTSGTTSWPGITCGQVQTSAQTGYLTSYTYSGPGNVGTLTGATQNVLGTSQQSRAYAYDRLGRLTSETNPETGTTTYTYDSDSAGTCPGPYIGDLVKRVDNAGNVTCYAYDGLHRLTYAGYTGPTCRHFRYDTSASTPPSGYNVSSAHTTARLEEAYTDNCAASMITDEWFGYDADGHTTDAWESTPSSSGYYHTTASYWPTGAVMSLSNIPGVPTIYYGGSTGSGLDGEGRVTHVVDVNGINLGVATYSQSTTTTALAGSLTNVAFNSGDSDGYTYDPNTGRMKSYTFSVNGKTDKGMLTWNPNGTLGILGIVDNLSGSADSQTCTYVYDDLARVAGIPAGLPNAVPGVNCVHSSTPVWSQTFMYDAFGNISKTGNPGGSFLPTYSPATNQFTLTGANVAYDANGNLLTDNLYSYTWDPNFGNPSSVTNQMGGNDSVYGLVYDALGRMVEQDDSFRECAIHICITSTPSQGQIVIRPRRAEAGIGERTESSEGVHSTARWRGSDLRLVGP